MKKEDLDLLKEILSIPTYFKKENLIKDFLIGYGIKHNYQVMTDVKGNIYFTKGKLNENEYFPCVSAHLDSVFVSHKELIEKNLKKEIIQTDNILTAINPLTNKQTGLAADDLAGVFISLILMDKFEKIKAAFFVEEEYGCLGSKKSDKLFFENVGYFIGFDAPTDNWYPEYLCGVKLFNDEFKKITRPILEKCNIDNITSRDPYTDAMAIVESYDFCSSVLPTGYYKWHTEKEYVNIDDIEKCINFGYEYINKLGNNKYKFDKNEL